MCKIPYKAHTGQRILYAFVELTYLKCKKQGFPGGPGAKNLPPNAGDTDLIPGWGRFHMPQSN